MKKLTLSTLFVLLLALTAPVHRLLAASPRAPKAPATTALAGSTSQPATRPSVNRTPALQHVADLALAAQARSGVITAERKELFQGLANHDTSLFELMSDPDPEVRIAAVTAAGEYPLQQFGPTAREPLVRAIPYLAEICRKDTKPGYVRHRPRACAWLRLREVAPDSCETIGNFILENDRYLRSWALTYIIDQKVEEMPEAEKKFLAGHVPEIFKAVVEIHDNKNPHTSRSFEAILAKLPEAEVRREIQKFAADPANAKIARRMLENLPQSAENDLIYFALVGPETRDYSGRLSMRDFAAGLASNDSATRRGAVLLLAQGDNKPTDSLLAKILTLPEKDEPAVRTAIGSIVCRLGEEKFAELVRSALLDPEPQQSQAHNLLTLAALAPLPPDIADAARSPSRSTQTLMLMGNGNRTHVVTGELRRQILTTSTNRNLQTHLAEQSLFASWSLGPVTRRAARKIVSEANSHGHPAVFYAEPSVDPDRSLPWSVAPAAATPSPLAIASSPAANFTVAILSLVLFGSVLLAAIFYYALQP